jgi:hypothetical protein
MALSTTQIYVSNLPAGTTDERLNAAFEQFGAIEDCFVPQRKRFGFVTFAAEADATKALTAMNGKSLDAAAAADASEEVIAVVAATPKPAEKEGEKKQPAKKQPKKKKEPKAQQKKKEPKEPAQQGAPAEKSTRRKRANKKAPAAKRAVPTFQDRMKSYDSDLGAKCLLLGYAHWEVAHADANYDKDEAGKPGSGFPGLEWLQAALTQRGLQNSLFKKSDTVTYSADGDSWTVTVAPEKGDNFILACKAKEAPAEAGLGQAANSLRTDLMNEAKFAISYDEEEAAINRAKLWLLEKCQGARAPAAAKAAAVPAEEAAAAPAEEDGGARGSSTHVDLKNLKDSGSGDLTPEEFAALRAKTKTAAEVAKNMTPEQQAAYGCKTGVAASAVREDSDDSDDEGADFVMGAEGQGALLADY